MRVLNATAIFNLLLAGGVMLFFTAIQKAASKSCGNHFFFDGLLKSLFLLGCIGLRINLEKKLGTSSYVMLPTAFLVLICLFVDLVAHMSNTIVHWPDDAVGFVLGYFCVVISVLSLALINNIVLACGLICWMCQKGKNSDSADHKSKKSERYKSTLLHLALLSMNCFIAGSLQFPDLIHLITGILGLIVAFEFQSCSKSMMTVSLVFSFLSLLNSIAAPVQFYVIKGAAVTLGNMSWFIFFAIVNVVITWLLHNLISKKQKVEDATVWDEKMSQGTDKVILVLEA